MQTVRLPLPAPFSVRGDGTTTPSTVNAMYDLALEVLDTSLRGEHYTLPWRAVHPMLTAVVPDGA